MSTELVRSKEERKEGLGLSYLHGLLTSVKSLLLSLR
jgi:hypothetical protein